MSIAPVNPPTDDGAIAQSVTITLRFLMVVIVILAVLWLAQGISEVAPGSRSVVFRFGRIVRVVDQGLVIAWPRPIEEVVSVPGPERQLSLHVTSLDLIHPDHEDMFGSKIDFRTDGGYALTGDDAVVHLQGTVVYQVEDAAAYVLAAPRVDGALTRLFCAAAVTACAQRSLDGVLVAHQEPAGPADAAAPAGTPGDGDEITASAERERLRIDIMRGMNARLHGLGLGVRVSRVDPISHLPLAAQRAFNDVTADEAEAARLIADANTESANEAQTAQGEADTIRADAQAQAQETIRRAQVTTASISAMLAERSPVRRQLLLTRLYRERIDDILKRCGQIVAADGTMPVRLAFPADPRPTRRPEP